MSLPSAPRQVVDAGGRPLFGRYQGATGAPAWADLAPPHARGALWRRLHHKRWHFVSLVTDELFVGLTVIDIGWSNSSFAYAFDRGRGEIVEAFSPVGLPGVTAFVGATVGEGAWFAMPGRRIAIEADGDDGHRLRLRAGRFRIEAEYGGSAGPRLLAVGPVRDGGAVHTTQKSPGLALAGWAEAGGRRYRLDGGVASFDYSNGLLGRRTGWRWISAHTPALGFNLQSGYFGDAENALWTGGQLVPLGAVHIAVDAGGAWTMATDDGLLDLRFSPEGTRRDDKNLLLAGSRLTQHVGRFDGWVKAAPDAPARPVSGLTGLAEDYSARW
ncbi:MAG: DUF2804 domain-containing protein [Pseudomonadota bacterium]